MVFEGTFVLPGFYILCLLCLLWLSLKSGSRKRRCAAPASLLLLLSRGSLPRMPTLGKLLDHLLIERGYIGRLPTGY